jgi:hypothetical protein
LVQCPFIIAPKSVMSTGVAKLDEFKYERAFEMLNVGLLNRVVSQYASLVIARTGS